MRGRFKKNFFVCDYAKLVPGRGRCLLDGDPKAYGPMFTVQEFSSHGFRTVFWSSIVGRPIHTMSQPEYYSALMFHAPEFGTVNICEQFALEPWITRRIALELGVRHPAIRGEDVIMSTDFVVTFRRPGGVLERRAYAVKRAKDLSRRVVQKLAIEEEYWTRRNTGWSLLLDRKLPMPLVSNMQLLIGYADIRSLPCEPHVIPVISAWLKLRLMRGLELGAAAAACDKSMGSKPGTALSVAYHLVLKGALPFDLRRGPLFSATMDECRAAA